MRFEGTVPIRASRERVWAFVIDPQQVGQCGPGVEKIEVVDASHFDATAEMRLSDGPDGATVMDWNADVNIAGTLASMGARLIEGTANKMISQTFDCMRAKLEA